MARFIRTSAGLLNLDHVVLIVGGEHGEDGDHAIVRLSDGQSITCQILDREGFELKDAKARAAGGPSREGFELKDARAMVARYGDRVEATITGDPNWDREGF